MIAEVTSIATFYHHHDTLSTRVVTSASGTVIEQQQTAPFGELMTDTGYGTNFKFTSYERDGETGSDYALNRQYAASTARFNQADPYDGSYDATGPQSLNRYSYTQNDPANLIDPTGLVWACWLLYQGREYGYVIICIDAGDPVIFPSEGKPRGGGGQRGTQQKQQQKPKCKQSKNGGDRPDIEAKLEAAGVSSNISNIRSAGPQSPEGILFDIDNREAFVSTIKSTKKFTQDIPFEHLNEVGGNAFNTAGLRSFSGAGNGGLGPDSTGFTRSLQIAVGPKGAVPNNPNPLAATGYADLDCDNPDQDVKSFFKHTIPIIGRRIGRLL
jgi:RHS repeat-associated protein